MRCLLALTLGALSLVACRDGVAPTTPTGKPPSTPSIAPEPIPGHYIVLYRHGASDWETRAQHVMQGAVLQQRFRTVFQGFAAALSPQQLSVLQHDPEVASIEPDVWVYQASTESSPGWGLDRIDQHTLPLNNAFNYSATGSGVNIYIVDGGIRYSHTEFGGRAHLAYDVFGGNGSDCDGHGTGVAGIAAGATYGVAKKATLWSVKVFPCTFSTALSNILLGVDWITRYHRNPAVANMSLTSPVVPTLDSAVKASIASGVTYVAAAGNQSLDACTQTPAHVAEVITATASDQTDTRPSWSNYGPCVDLIAPGVSVPSADYPSDVATANWNGTSFSSPYVAGAAAQYLELHPSATPSQVQQALIAAATTGKVLNVSTTPNRLLFTTSSTTTSSTPTTTTSTSSNSAKFTFTCSNSTCYFDASTSTAVAGINSYNWKFGDGTSAGAIKLGHTYVVAGSAFTVQLTVIDNKMNPWTASATVNPAGSSGSSGGTTSTTTTTTTSPSTSFVPRFTVSCGSGHTCWFDASGSSVPNGASSYNWKFGDGTSAGAIKVGHTYASAGARTVTLSVVDLTYKTASVSQTVNVP